MALSQLHTLDSFIRLGALVVIGVVIHFWINRRVISYKTAQCLMLSASLLTGITGGVLAGWAFSAGVTFGQTLLLYFVAKFTNKRLQEKENRQIEKNNDNPNTRIF